MRLLRLTILLPLCALLLWSCSSGRVRAPGPAPEPEPQQPPGRLFTLHGGALTIRQGYNQTTVDLPEYFQPLALSPDGKLLAGQVNRALLLLLLDGGAPISLGETTGGALAAWSPDGSQLAFANGRFIVITDREARVQRNTLIAMSETRDVQWSPDGKSVLVAFGPPHFSLYRIEAESGQITELEREVAQQHGTPRWAPDGGQITAVAYQGRGPSSLITVSAAGKPAPILDTARLAGAVRHPANLFAQNQLNLNWHGWSPTGERIAATFKAAGSDPYFGLVTAAPDGKALRVLLLPKHPDHPETQMEFPRRPCYPGRPLWTPDGSHLIARLAGPGCAGQVFVYEAASLQVVQELQVAPGQPELFLSPDGLWLAAPSEQGELILFPIARPHQQVHLEGKLLGWLD